MNKIIRISIFLALFSFAIDGMAQKRKTTKKKAKKTVVKKAPEVFKAIPVDSVIGKAYVGKVGQTVVDFFGSRKTYGDVNQELYIGRDSIAVLRQIMGAEEDYTLFKYRMQANLLCFSAYYYNVSDNGNKLALKRMKENDEWREGTLSRTEPYNILNNIFQRGKYLDRMTEQTEEEKLEASTFIMLAAEGGIPEAQKYVLEKYRKRADNGEAEALRYMAQYEATVGNYAAAHGYFDKLIDLNPSDASLLADKGMLFLQQNKASDAKKMWKKIKKADSNFYNSSNHPFCQKMR